VVFEGFESDFDAEARRYLPTDAPAECLGVAFERREQPDAIEGAGVLHVNVQGFCSERILLDVPRVQGSYRASVWMRHGSIDAQLTAVYPPESGLELLTVKLAPSGRTTSDGWVELESNAFPIDGAAAQAVYLRVTDVDDQGSEIDGIELLPDGAYWSSNSCSGLGDSACGDGEICVHQRCRLGRLYVPPLPSDLVRQAMVDVMQSKLRVFFGGRKTRLEDLPEALAILESIRWVDDAWAFWHGWARAVNRLHDWHTSLSGPIGGIGRNKRLDACFIEGVADLTQASWPSDPRYRDLLVSHVGSGDAAGLTAGDRLVAVDGKHPIEWALGLRDAEWGLWLASDSTVYAEVAERMRSLITKYATSFTVLRCAAGSCAVVPETIVVADLPEPQGGRAVRCDNRPFYHLQSGNPAADHDVGYQFFRGRIAGTSDQEAIYGFVWDTLAGGGDPNGWVNGNIQTAIDDFKANARGVILDHRAGSGGTLDGAELVTTLVRPPTTPLVFHSPMPVAGSLGPDTAAEGVELFKQFDSVSPMRAGAADHDPDLPVALLLHRDGSASDFMPFAMKGAPKVRLFAPFPTAGAFSTFYYLQYWGGVALQLASGDSIASDGRALLGHGVEPDVVVQHTQSDLQAGRDALHEAALAWVRQELKP
jgi:hypothetical protein